LSQIATNKQENKIDGENHTFHNSRLT